LGSVILAMFFLHHYCPANTELNGARSKAADGKSRAPQGFDVGLTLGPK
jgi:hypothetical protein